MFSEKENKAFKFSLFLCFFYSLPIILWGGYYWDDVIRTTKGLYGWKENGRPLSEMVFYVLNYGGINADFYPLPQLASVLIMAFASFLSWKKFIPNKPAYTVLCFTPIFTSPMFVENLSFRYDSLTMSLSVLVALAPFVLRPVAYKFRFIIASICAIAFLSLYQASITVYICFAVINALHISFTSNNEKAIKQTAIYVAAIIFGYLIYSNAISNHFLEGNYNLVHSKIANPFKEDSFGIYTSNFSHFFELIKKGSSGWISVGVKSSLLIFVCITVFHSYKCVSSPGLYNKLFGILCLLSLPVLLFSMIGPVALLESPIFTPRVLIGYGAAISSFFYASLVYTNDKFRLTSVIISISYISMLLFSFAFANSQKSQDSFEEAISYQMISDMSRKELSDVNYISINGRMPKSPQTLIEEKKYPIIHNLTPILMNNGSGWGMERLNQYGMKKPMAGKDVLEATLAGICKSEKVSSGNFYDIYISGDVAIFDFSRSCK